MYVYMYGVLFNLHIIFTKLVGIHTCMSNPVLELLWGHGTGRGGGGGGGQNSWGGAGLPKTSCLTGRTSDLACQAEPLT